MAENSVDTFDSFWNVMKRKQKADIENDLRRQFQILLGMHLRELGVQRIEYEFQFFEPRKWMADIHLPDYKVLIEVDGGMHTGGHKRGRKLEDDYIKEDMAQLLGYKFFRFSNHQVSHGVAKDILRCFKSGWMNAIPQTNS